MSDEEVDWIGGISDAADFTSKAATAADIEYKTDGEIETAVQNLISAAAEARGREFTTIGPGSTDDQGREVQGLVDSATGVIWQSADGGYVNTATMEWTAKDPREPDPSAYESVAERFRYFYERSPSDVQVMVEQTNYAKEALESGQMSAIIGVKDAVFWWGGDARDNFIEYFLNPFALGVVANQQELVQTLIISMHAYDAMLRQARNDVVMIAEKAIDVFDKMTATTGWQLAELGLGLAEAALGVFDLSGASADEKAEGVLNIVFESAVVVYEARPQPEYPELSGATVAQVLASVEEALDKLQTIMDEEEEHIATPVTDAGNEVERVLATSRPNILPKEPADRPGVTGGDNPPLDEFAPRS